MRLRNDEYLTCYRSVGFAEPFALIRTARDECQPMYVFKSWTRTTANRAWLLINANSHAYACCLITPCSRVLLEKLTGSQLVKKFPFYGTRRFITAFTIVRHLSLSWARTIQSMPPHPTSWRFILILSSHPYVGLPSCLFPTYFPTKTLYTPLLHHTCYMPSQSHSSHFTTRTILREEYRSFSSSLCSFLHTTVTSSLLGPNILLSILFSNTLSLRSSLGVSDQVSQPYKTTGKLWFCVS